jgi:hypothetical protein
VPVWFVVVFVTANAYDPGFKVAGDVTTTLVLVLLTTEGKRAPSWTVGAAPNPVPVIVNWPVAVFTCALVIAGAALWAWTVDGLLVELHPHSTAAAVMIKRIDRGAEIKHSIASPLRY